MGFFSKIFKGVKKVFKKVGKAVKSTFKSVGKFMGKIGIVGQLAVGLFMPYALGFLGSTLGGWAGTLMQSANPFVSGAGKFLNAAVKMGTRVGQAFSSVTEAVKTTIGDMVGATLNKIPGAGDFIKGFTKGRIDITGKTFSGAWEATQKAWTNAGDSLGNIFSKSTFDSSLNKFALDKQMLADKEFLDTAQPDFSDPVQRTGVTIQGDMPDLMTKPLTDADVDFLNVEATTDFSSKSLLTPETGPRIAEQDIFMAGRERALRDPLSVSEDAFMKAREQALADLPSVAEASQAKYSASELGTRVGALAEELGAPTTGTQVVQSLLGEDEMGGGTYVDRRSTMVVQGGDIPSIYPSASQMEYGNMLSSYYPQYNAPSIVDSILNQDWGSIYGQGYYGFPSLQAGIANAAGSGQ